MVLGEPHAVVAGAIHDVDTLERALINGFQRDAPRPRKELQDSEFQDSLQRSVVVFCTDLQIKPRSV